MKHTPAPWTLEIDDECLHPWAIVDSNPTNHPQGPMSICLVNPNFGEESEANARLIAAAPELLEALRELMAQAVKDAEKYAPEGNEPIWAFISDASTAIHKATA